MKKLLFILTIIISSIAVFAQDQDPEDQGGKLQERMQEFVQRRLNLTSDEAQKFSPIFIRYIVELRKTHREHKDDRPMQQLKVAELRIRFRDEFRKIVGDERANKVFQHQKEFENKVRREIMERRKNRRNGTYLQRTETPGQGIIELR